MKYLIAICVLVLASCNQSHGEPATYNTTYGVGYGGYPFGVTKITMYDNTVCYVARGPDRGIGLQCFQDTRAKGNQ